MQAVQKQDASTVTPIDALDMMQPVSELSKPYRARLLDRAKVQNLKAGDRIDGTKVSRWLVYLIEGSINLITDIGESLSMEYDADKIVQPIFVGERSKWTLECAGPVKLLCFDSHLFEALQSEEVLDGVDVVGIELDEKQNQLFEKIFNAYSDKTLELPSLPDVALKIRTAAEKEDIGAADIARIVEADPALVARLIQVANSPMHRGAAPSEHAREAVVRLGIDVTKTLTTSLAVKDLFKAKRSITKKRMQALHAHSVKVAALSYVLAKRVKGLKPERALLAGLVHDIGAMPVLTYADDHEELVSTEGQLEQAIDKLRGVVGALVLGRWGFDEEMIAVAEHAEAWDRDHEGDVDYCDVIIAAQVYSLAGTPAALTLPGPDFIPAVRKLGLVIDCELDASILEEAQDELSELQALLS